MSIKRMSKIVVALVIIATILSTVSMVFGVDIPTPKNPTNAGLRGTVSNIMGIIQFICYAAAVILIVLLGIKFMTASPDAKAEIKKSAVIYVVGAALVFAAGVIITLIQNVVNSTIVQG